MAWKLKRSDTAATSKPTKLPQEWRDVYGKDIRDVVAKQRPSTPSALQSIRDTLIGIQDALTKDAASQWAGTAEEWLLTRAFVEDPWDPRRERFYAPKRPDDYCRRKAREGKAIGVPKISAATVRTLWPRRLNRVKLPK
jgi:hypothetical protein